AVKRYPLDELSIRLQHVHGLISFAVVEHEQQPTRPYLYVARMRPGERASQLPHLPVHQLDWRVSAAAQVERAYGMAGISGHVYLAVEVGDTIGFLQQVELKVPPRHLEQHGL